MTWLEDWFVVGILCFAAVVLQMVIVTVWRVSARHPPYWPLHHVRPGKHRRGRPPR